MSIPYPEIMIQCVESEATSGRGGARWAPMFASAELFEDDFRDGAHRRVIKGVENTYDLTQRAIDQEFPSGGKPTRLPIVRSTPFCWIRTAGLIVKPLLLLSACCPSIALLSQAGSRQKSLGIEFLCW
jgi:hypothetical protein